MDWSLRYAPHVGYAPPDLLLFRALAGNTRAEHVRFAARQGMAGILFPWAGDSSAEERAAVKAALQETGLECSCIVTTPLAVVLEPIWVTPGPRSQAKLLEHVTRSIEVAKDLGSRTLAVLIRGDGVSATPVQKRRASDHLRTAADIAARHEMVLAIEPMIALPDMLLRSFAEGVEFLRAMAHPSIKLIFDTGHLTDMGDPLISSYVEAYDDIGLIQLADMPGRVQVGGGNLQLAELLAHAIHRGYAGLVDLEHDWTDPGADGERRGIEQLRAIDAQAKRIASGFLKRSQNL